MKIEGVFSLFGNVARGMTSELARLETVSENIANSNQVAGRGEPIYHRKTVDPQSGKDPFASHLRKKKLNLARRSSGHIAGTREKNRFHGTDWPESKVIEHPNEKTVYDPSHPKADQYGFVRMPDINVVSEMMEMIVATRSYEANTSVLTAAKQLAKKTMEI